MWWCEAWKATRDPFLPEVMLMARALKLGALLEWSPCLRLCGLLPESVVTHSGLAQGPGWKQRRRELNRVSRHWVPDPREGYEKACRQRGELALAGQRWADNDQNPVEQFVHRLHGMFVVVLRGRMQREEEACLLFLVEQRKAPQDCYPWHQLQPPFPRPCWTELPELGPLPSDWKRGDNFLRAVLRWLSELQWLLSDDSLPEAH